MLLGHGRRHRREVSWGGCSRWRGSRSGSRSVSSTPRRTRPRRRWGSCSSASTTIRSCSTASRTGLRRSRTSSRTSLSRRPSGSGAIPGAAALEASQDRLVEKQLFRRLGIPTPKLDEEVEAFPAILKTRRLGYDGKGQRLVETWQGSDPGHVLEERVPFDRELSLIAVRAADGDTRFYPLVENVHEDGILRTSRAPAADAPQAEAEEYAGALLDALGYVGVLALELFDVGGRLLANEFAPRVHNTGHWTIEGAATSQFENHLRAVLGLPLGPTESRPSVMVNLIGATPPAAEVLAIPGAHLHLYGKEPRPGRKLGHITLVEPTATSEKALRTLVSANQAAKPPL